MNRVLIVDDEFDIRISLQAILERENLDTLLAEDFTTAKEQIEQEDIDIVLSDIILPDGNGLDILKTVKENNNKIPVIMMTGAPSLETAKASIRGGAYDYLSKPLRKAKVMPVIKRAVERKNLLDAKERLEAENLAYQLELEKKVEERTAQLRESQKKYETLVNASNDAIYLTVGDNFEFVNPKFEELFGYTQEEIASEDFNIWKLISDESVDTIKQREKLEAKNRIPRYEFKAETKYGEILDVEVNTTPLIYNDKKAILGVLRDVTEKKKAQEELERTNRKLKRAIKDLQQLVNLKTEFANNVSHEFRTPLTIIAGYIDLLLGKTFGNLGEKEVDVLRKIKEQTQHLIRLVNNVMNFSKFQKEDFEIDKSWIHLSKIVTKVIDEFAHRAKNREVEINFTTEDGISEIYADETKIEQVVYALLDNAVKFTKSGHIDINIKEEDNSYILFSIADTGVGIPESEMDIIFEGFRQVDGSATRKFGGTGLGLHLSKKIIEKHGGNIWADSVVDEGSVFYFTLPINPPMS